MLIFTFFNIMKYLIEIISFYKIFEVSGHTDPLGRSILGYPWFKPVINISKISR